MKKYIEYGVFGAAILTLIYLVLAFVTGVSITVTTVLLAVLGGLISGLIITLLSSHFAPGEVIPEGEEDKYITGR